MKAVSRVHITPHMHWDREWYFTTEESRILLVNNMEEILCRLEQDNEYKYYVLDGQTAILEDYFAVKPENKDRVKKQVEAGKLIIGPWYTQTDTTIVSAESKNQSPPASSLPETNSQNCSALDGELPPARYAESV